MFISTTDLITGLTATGIIVLLVIVIEWVCARQLLKPTDGRKLLHAGAIITCAVAIARFTDRHLLALIFFAAAALLWVIVRKKWLRVGQTDSYGIALFPLAFGLLLCCPALPVQITLFAVLTLGICDAAAGFAGERLAKYTLVFWKEKKSWLGGITFFLTNMVLAFCLRSEWSAHGLLVAAVWAIVPALTELFSWRGSDNLTVPLVTAAWVYLLQAAATPPYPALAVLIPVLAGLARGAVLKRWLTPGGAAAALWMGIVLYAGAGPAGLVCPALFLAAGSLLGKLNPDPLEKAGRQAVQVFANGLPGTVCCACYAITGHLLWLEAMILSFGASMSDSVSAELGKFAGGKTIDITRFKPVAKGLSGGISFVGTLAGLAAALVLVIAGKLLFGLPWPRVWPLTLLAFAGMLADSLLGSSLQAKYADAAGRIGEQPAAGSSLVGGWQWCNNDVVNFLANALVVIAYLSVSWGR